MFTAEKQAVENQIRTYCTQSGLPDSVEYQWSPIPFAGEWGISTSFFQLAALEARSRADRIGLSPVPQRAQEIAAEIAKNLKIPAGFSHAEAVKGYLNLYFSTAIYCSRVMDMVLAQGTDFGRGQTRDERVMVEYAQPNTHHSFHIGHYRNTILGEALARHG